MAGPAHRVIAGPIARRWWLFLGLSFAARWMSLVVPIFNADEAAHAVGSWVVLDGGSLYVDFVDNKPPLLYVFYGAAQLLFGRGVIAVHVLTLIALVPLTALAVSAFFRHDRRGLVAGGAYVLFSAAAHDGHEMLATNAEILMAMPAAWALALLADEAAPARRLVAAGALLGLAIACKQQAVLWLPALPLVTLLAPGPAGPRARLGQATRQSAWLALGTALPLVAITAWFAVDGRLGALVHACVVSIVAYLHQGPSPRESLVRLLAVVPLALTTFGLWISAARSVRAAPAAHTTRLLVVTLALSVVGLCLGGRLFPHYFIQVLVPLCLAAAPAATATLARPRGLRWLAYPGLLVLVMTAINGTIYAAGPLNNHDELHPALLRVVARLAHDPCRADATLFAWGQEPLLYYLSGLPPASRYVLPQATISGYVPGNRQVIDGRRSSRDLISEDERALLLGDLARTPPTYVLDVTDAPFALWRHFPMTGFPGLAALVARDLEPIDRIDDVVIWRRRGCEAQQLTGVAW